MAVEEEEEDRKNDVFMYIEFSLARESTVEEVLLYSSMTRFVVTIDGRCFVTAMFSMDTEISRLRQMRWQEYTQLMPLSTILPSSAVAVASELFALLEVLEECMC